MGGVILSFLFFIHILNHSLLVTQEDLDLHASIISNVIEVIPKFLMDMAPCHNVTI